MLIQQPCSFFNLCSCSCLPWAAPRLCCRAPEPVKFPTPLHLRLHYPVFPISGSFQSGASPSSTASLRSARCGQQTRVIGRGLYVESLTAGTHEVHGRTQGKFLLIKLKKCFLPLTAGTHRLYLLTAGNASLLCEKNYFSRRQLGPVRFGG